MFVILSLISVTFAASYGGNNKIVLPKTVLKTQNYEESQNVVELVPNLVKEQVTLKAHVPEFEFKEIPVEKTLEVPTVSFQQKITNGEVKIPKITFQSKDSYVETFIPKVEYTKATTSSTQFVPVVVYEDVEVTRYQLVPKVVYEDIKLSSFQHIPKLAYETEVIDTPQYGISYQPQDRVVEYQEKQFWPELVPAPAPKAY